MLSMEALSLQETSGNQATAQPPRNTTTEEVSFNGEQMPNWERLGVVLFSLSHATSR